MNNLPKNIIQLCCQYFDKNSNNSYRQCSKYFSIIVGRIYFSSIKIYSKIIRKNKHHFRYFAHKYKLFININYVHTISELSYYNTYNVKSIRLTDEFNELYCEYVMPPTLQKLKYGYDTNKYIMTPPIRKKTLPSTLKSLSLGIYYDTVIKKDVLPSSLKKLDCGFYFNQRIDVLPPILQVLKFGPHFNQPIKVLPPTLKKLILGTSFNQPLEGILSPTLEELVLGYSYNNPIIIYPSTLKSLTINNDFNQIINKNILPSGLENLKLMCDFSELINTNISFSKFMEHQIPCYDENKLNKFLVELLPLKLKRLSFTNQYDHLVHCYLHFNSRIYKNTLPSSLEYLDLGYYFNQELNELPPNLKTLKLGFSYNQPIKKNILPPTLEKLKFGNSFNQPIEKDILPPNLKKLIFGDKFNQEINDILPSKLEKLVLPACGVNKPRGVLPSKIPRIEYSKELL